MRSAGKMISLFIETTSLLILIHSKPSWHCTAAGSVMNTQTGNKQTNNSKPPMQGGQREHSVGLAAAGVWAAPSRTNPIPAGLCWLLPSAPSHTPALLSAAVLDGHSEELECSRNQGRAVQSAARCSEGQQDLAELPKGCFAEGLISLVQ